MLWGRWTKGLCYQSWIQIEFAMELREGGRLRLAGEEEGELKRVVVVKRKRV